MLLSSDGAQSSVFAKTWEDLLLLSSLFLSFSLVSHFGGNRCVSNS